MQDGVESLHWTFASELSRLGKSGMLLLEPVSEPLSHIHINNLHLPEGAISKCDQPKHLCFHWQWKFGSVTTLQLDSAINQVAD